VKASSADIHADIQVMPEWITVELIAETIKVWQPKYPQPLTDHDVIEILLSVGHLLDFLGDGDDVAVSGTGESF
jgi:hypothetical protein